MKKITRLVVAAIVLLSAVAILTFAVRSPPVENSEVTPVEDSEVTPVEISEVTPVEDSEVTLRAVHAWETLDTDAYKLKWSCNGSAIITYKTIVGTTAYVRSVSRICRDGNGRSAGEFSVEIPRVDGGSVDWHISIDTPFRVAYGAELCFLEYVESNGAGRASSLLVAEAIRASSGWKILAAMLLS